MKINIKAMAATSALLWGSAVLTVALANRIRPRYGREFLRVLGSIYPGYHARRTLDNVFVATTYAIVDGAVGGAVCAWLYNRTALAVHESSAPDHTEQLRPERAAKSAL